MFSLDEFVHVTPRPITLSTARLPSAFYFYLFFKVKVNLCCMGEIFKEKIYCLTKVSNFENFKNKILVHIRRHNTSVVRTVLYLVEKVL